MENRTIIIANNKTQRRYSIETSATTLGELQDQMIEQGIDFSGMTFTEGISKTQLLTRDSLLPTNVMYKGQPTNNLVMLLTNPNKQIASGAMNRKELYAKIKELGIQDSIKEEFGKNYTMVGNADLACMIERAEAFAHELDDEEDEVEDIEEETGIPQVRTAPHANTVNWIYDGIKALLTDGSFYTEDVYVLNELITELANRLHEATPTISDADIDDMIANL
jgi:hypothetical protein